MPKEDKEKVEEKEENKKKNKKIQRKTDKNQESFFRYVYNSLIKIEKYPEMATKGIRKAISYLFKITLIFSIMVGIGMIYQTRKMVNENVDRMNTYFPEYEYREGILDVKSDEMIKIDREKSLLGKTIIDTKIEQEETINKYKEELEQEKLGGIILLRDKAIFVKMLSEGNMEFRYEDILNSKNIKEFNKQDVVEYLTGSKMTGMYLNLLMITIIYTVTIYMISIILNVFLLSLFGNIVALFTRMKIKYSAMFSMAAYAITLSTILNMIYVGINIFVPFNMKYFQLMYMTVASIYVIAAIFILKTEIIKQQFELKKIVEAQEEVKKELDERKREEERENEKKDRKKKDKEVEKKQKDNEEKKEGEPEGQKA